MKLSMRLRYLAPVFIQAFAAISATTVLAVEPPTVEVYKSPTCGCCTEWVAHMKKNGFNVQVHDVRNVTPIRQRFGVPDSMESCHSAMVGGYAVEGHVPAADVKRLLRERPKATGIAVPGMAQGSPGMEQGGREDRYQVLLFDGNGRYTVFERH